MVILDAPEKARWPASCSDEYLGTLFLSLNKLVADISPLLSAVDLKLINVFFLFILIQHE